jgi:methyl-accepting chemotaxis protein
MISDDALPKWVWGVVGYLLVQAFAAVWFFASLNASVGNISEDVGKVQTSIDALSERAQANSQSIATIQTEIREIKRRLERMEEIGS